LYVSQWLCCGNRPTETNEETDFYMHSINIRLYRIENVQRKRFKNKGRHTSTEYTFRPFLRHFNYFRCYKRTKTVHAADSAVTGNGQESFMEPQNLIRGPNVTVDTVHAYDDYGGEEWPRCYQSQHFNSNSEPSYYSRKCNFQPRNQISTTYENFVLRSG
jgi:hypothetical protein